MPSFFITVDSDTEKMIRILAAKTGSSFTEAAVLAIKLGLVTPVGELASAPKAEESHNWKAEYDG